MTAQSTTIQEQRTDQGLGTLIFLLSETLFFGVLILVFLFFRANADPIDLAGGQLLDRPRALLFTLALIASSFTMWRAEKRFHAGDRRDLAQWLLITVALGVVFLFGQVTEYIGLWNGGLRISTNLLGTQFYTLTGLHFLHVTAGVLMLTTLLIFAWRGKPNEPGMGALQPITYYWHFVDIVWVILFTVVYLIPLP